MGTEGNFIPNTFWVQATQKKLNYTEPWHNLQNHKLIFYLSTTLLLHFLNSVTHLAEHIWNNECTSTVIYSPNDAFKPSAVQTQAQGLSDEITVLTSTAGKKGALAPPRLSLR